MKCVACAQTEDDDEDIKIDAQNCHYTHVRIVSKENKQPDNASFFPARCAVLVIFLLIMLLSLASHIPAIHDEANDYAYIANPIMVLSYIMLAISFIHSQYHDRYDY